VPVTAVTSPRFSRRALLAGVPAAVVLSACKPGGTGATVTPIPELPDDQLVRVPPQHLRYLPDPIPLAPARPEGPGPTVEPFVDPLPVPPVLRADATGEVTVTMRSGEVRLHSALPPARVWGYEGAAVGPTIEARRGVALRVQWRNELTGPYPAVPVAVEDNVENEPPSWDYVGREGQPLESIARLPPHTVVHLHGAVVGGGHDGWPENTVPPGGVQLVEYPNDQPAAGLWYHDHAMHVTRYMVMAGLTAGSYLVRDDEEAALGLPAGEFEIPLMIADRHLDTDEDGALTGQVLYKTVLFPSETTIVQRAFTGPFTLVNGVVWPHLEVAPRCYRFRVLNACHLRPYRLQLTGPDGEPVPAGVVTQIGTDAGLLPAPVPVDGALLLAPAERADLLVDFSAFPGAALHLANVDEDPGPWPHVMQFRVRDAAPAEPFRVPAVVSASFDPVPADLPVAAERLIVITRTFPGEAEMWEMARAEAPAGDLPVDGIVQVRGPDGAVVTWERTASRFSAPLGITALCDSWERWSFLNLEQTGYFHPMHLHATAFQAQSRDLYDVDGFEYFLNPDGSVGGGTRVPVRYVEPGVLGADERGWKDVIRTNRRELVAVAANFRRVPGRFVYHCHVYEHEDMAMMRPLLLRLPGTAELGTRRPGQPVTGHGH
jgi:FtsP/CotA-like multicopper oxidase with cupredoxin domain